MVVLNYQRTYNWLGAKKEIKRTQANSGLAFDELIAIVKASAYNVDLSE